MVNVLMPQALALTSYPVQASIGLQSAAGLADPECDYPSGSVHFYQLTEQLSDLRDDVEGFAQPVLFVTSPAVPIPPRPPLPAQ